MCPPVRVQSIFWFGTSHPFPFSLYFCLICSAAAVAKKRKKKKRMQRQELSLAFETLKEVLVLPLCCFLWDVCCNDRVIRGVS